MDVSTYRGFLCSQFVCVIIADLNASAVILASRTFSMKMAALSDQIEECAAIARNHGKFVNCVATLTNALKKAGTITGKYKGAIQSCAGMANMP